MLVGSAKEHPVRSKLEHILPAGIAVGSGCVIDSYGETSKQMDVVLYEKNICPVYSINDTPETTYYPCEGIVAVGEIKSSLNSDELEDIFDKIESVKRLRRFFYRTFRVSCSWYFRCSISSLWNNGTSDTSDLW